MRSRRRPASFLRIFIPASLLLLSLYFIVCPLPSSSSSADTAVPKFKTPPGLSFLFLGGKVKNKNTSGHNGAQQPLNPSEPAPGSSAAKQNPSANVGGHPIDRLISVGEKEYENMMAKESHTIAEAAAAYRKRRGRHPPPGFDTWYKFAKDSRAVIVEDFWDQAYQDLAPFWAVPALQIRKEAWDFEMTISVRDGKAHAKSDWFWTQIWLKMIKTIEHLLPDMDLALNAMDEPRLVVPWEQMSRLMNEADKTIALADPKVVVGDFQKLPKPGEGRDRTAITQRKNWEHKRPYWEIARRGCAPTSPARKAKVMRDFDHPPQITESLARPHMYQGYVANFSLSADICHQPDLQGLEGIFIEPLSVSSTKALFPMFGGSKLAVNNEILLPAPMYWSAEERFTGGEDRGIPWRAKLDAAVWRGVATGGKNTAKNWRGFQRHRFVAMNNSTMLSKAENWSTIPPNFALPSPSYGIKAQGGKGLGEWVNKWSDTGFVDLMCSPEQEDSSCAYTGPYFGVTENVAMNDQFQYKYLPDIDGNSFSGRYLGFLRSTSLPIKATIWREWHDSRLIAWKHFVPMDTRFGDWFGIMEYFLGYGNTARGHDAAAAKIANAGKEWAEKVLRKEDMQVYAVRLLLEYARVSDERRDKMGWVDDLTGGSRYPEGGD